MERAIFFDRDGTLNHTFVWDNKPYAPTRPKDLTLFPETAQTLRELKTLGYLLVIVSNQPDIALGKINEETKESLKMKFRELLEDARAPIDAIYYCHHHPDSINPDYPSECNCRKPKPGMIHRAATDFNIDLSKSWVVGDIDKDVNLGISVGCKTILLKQSYSGQCQPNYTIDNLQEVVIIIKRF